MGYGLVNTTLEFVALPDDLVGNNLKEDSDDAFGKSVDFRGAQNVSQASQRDLSDLPAG